MLPGRVRLSRPPRPMKQMPELAKCEALGRNPTPDGRHTSSSGKSRRCSYFDHRRFFPPISHTHIRRLSFQSIVFGTIRGGGGGVWEGAGDVGDTFDGRRVCHTLSRSQALFGLSPCLPHVKACSEHSPNMVRTFPAHSPPIPLPPFPSLPLPPARLDAT